VTEKQVTDFFSFCGKIQKLELKPDGGIAALNLTDQDKQKAFITFERPSAARTALLLQDAHLGTSQVKVTSSETLEGSSTPPSAESHTSQGFSQEDKPRTAVLAGKYPHDTANAEYLSHGYTLTDQALQRAIDYDHKNGISQRFYNVLNSALVTAQSYDQKLGVTQRAAAVDEKYAIQERAKSTATGLWQYFENALDTPTGKKVRSFYDDRRKDVLDIHTEARRYIRLQWS
jgi:RNA recognition motif-containing protein